MKELVLKSDDGREYKVEDVNRFYQHLIDFHTDNSIGNNSVHEENGYYFTVTPSFYEVLKNLLKIKINNLKSFAVKLY